MDQLRDEKKRLVNFIQELNKYIESGGSGTSLFGIEPLTISNDAGEELTLVDSYAINYKVTLNAFNEHPLIKERAEQSSITTILNDTIIAAIDPSHRNADIPFNQRLGVAMNNLGRERGAGTR